MGGGITVSINDGEIERTISRLVAGVELADVETAALIDAQLEAGKRIARKNIQMMVYAIPQKPSGKRGISKRTYTLLNSVRAGTISRAGTIRSGQVYISRQPFKRVYYPVYVEYGHEAGAPYEGRGYWAATVAELVAGIHIPVAKMANTVASKMVK